MFQTLEIQSINQFTKTAWLAEKRFQLASTPRLEKIRRLLQEAPDPNADVELFVNSADDLRLYLEFFEILALMNFRGVLQPVEINHFFEPELLAISRNRKVLDLASTLGFKHLATSLTRG